MKSQELSVDLSSLIHLELNVHHNKGCKKYSELTVHAFTGLQGKAL